MCTPVKENTSSSNENLCQELGDQMDKANLPNDQAPFHFSTKGGTLERLAPYVTRATLCNQIIIPTTEWRLQREDIISKIVRRFGSSLLAIRSSAASEDGADNSMAGVHLSHTNVTPTPNLMTDAIDTVIESYPQPNDGDQVLVQPMVADVVISGVVLTRDLDTGSPYYVVNYDDLSGRTDTVTGGSESKTILIHRARPDAIRSPRFRKLVDSVIELEQITGSDELDIEFCITGNEEIFILQVRALAARRQWERTPDKAIDTALDKIRDRLRELMAPNAGIAGKTTILGEMPDWNPAEMIGNAPRPLALSLYKILITDSIWATARSRMGYRHVGKPLLIDFCGRPFVDVRLSFNSFLPQDIDEDFANRLVDHQISMLEKREDLHDKIEFEIAITCRDFSFSGAKEKLRQEGIAEVDLEALESGLTTITHNALKSGATGIEKLVDQSNRLLENPTRPETLQPLERMESLLDACRTLGTLPFSQLARHGFIGVLFLNSLVKREVFTQEDADRFMAGIHTVAADLVHDMHRLATGTIDQAAFLSQYGHLRPSTYDILSFRYDERPDLYLGHSRPVPELSEAPFIATKSQHSAISALLKEFGYEITPDDLLAYIAAAIKGREQSKFAFTKSISDALASLCSWGKSTGLPRDEISFLHLEDVIGKTDHGVDIGLLKARIEERRETYQLTRSIRLGHLIGDPSDIDVIRLPLGHPTFITSKKVTAKSAKLSAGKVPEIDRRIVLIESADPGFDWIFSHPIAGLITKYGGTNSHMSIRCAEFGLPAAIGCGERLFNSMAAGSIIELDCAARTLIPH
jgi:glutamine kinase